MINRNAVRFLAALIAIVLAAGLVEYAHLDGVGRHALLVPATHTPSIVVGPALPASHMSSNPRPASSTLAPGHYVTGHARTTDKSLVTARPKDPDRHAAAVSRSAVGLIYVVKPGDTLWHLSAAYLGNPILWTKLFALNKGRHEPDGHAFVDPNRIYPGWTIEVPIDPTGLRLPDSNELIAPHVAPDKPATQMLALGAPTRDSSQ